jgi:hypothetical protein
MPGGSQIAPLALRLHPQVGLRLSGRMSSFFASADVRQISPKEDSHLDVWTLFLNGRELKNVACTSNYCSEKEQTHVANFLARHGVSR